MCIRDRSNIKSSNIYRIVRLIVKFNILTCYIALIIIVFRACSIYLTDDYISFYRESGREE